MSEHKRDVRAGTPDVLGQCLEKMSSQRQQQGFKEGEGEGQTCQVLEREALLSGKSQMLTSHGYPKRHLQGLKRADPSQGPSVVGHHAGLQHSSAASHLAAGLLHLSESRGNHLTRASNTTYQSNSKALTEQSSFVDCFLEKHSNTQQRVPRAPLGAQSCRVNNFQGTGF